MPERTETPQIAYTWLLLLFSLGLWLATGLGLAAQGVETACITPMLLYLLPFLGSGFVAVGSLSGSGLIEPCPVSRRCRFAFPRLPPTGDSWRQPLSITEEECGEFYHLQHHV